MGASYPWSYVVGRTQSAIRSRVAWQYIPEREAGYPLLGGLRFAFPDVRVVIADDGHDSRKLTPELRRYDGYKVRIVKRKHRSFKISGLTWIVERSFAWLGRYRRLSKDYEFRVQASEAMTDLAAIGLCSIGLSAHRASRTLSERWQHSRSWRSNAPDPPCPPGSRL